MKVISILIDCAFVWAIWGLSGMDYVIALAVYIVRSSFSFIEGIKNDN